jgi:hypothetical protein
MPDQSLAVIQALVVAKTAVFWHRGPRAPLCRPLSPQRKRGIPRAIARSKELFHLSWNIPDHVCQYCRLMARRHNFPGYAPFPPPRSSLFDHGPHPGPIAPRPLHPRKMSPSPRSLAPPSFARLSPLWPPLRNFKHTSTITLTLTLSRYIYT